MENPQGAGNLLSYDQLCEEVQAVFGTQASALKLFENGIEVTPTTLATAVGKTLTTEPSTKNRFTTVTINGSLCPFVDVQYQGKCGTLLLENPVGCSVTKYANEVLSTLFRCSVASSKKLKTGSDVVDLHCLTPDQWERLNGKTVEIVL